MLLPLLATTIAFAQATETAPAAPGDDAAHMESPMEEPAAEGTEAPVEPAEPLPVTERANAMPLGSLDKRALARFEPKHRKLPQLPYGHTGFSAYTLEWGEFEVGSGGVRAGVLPRTQLGTILAANLAGAANGQLKVDALRLGPVDVAVQGGMLALPSGEFSLRQLEAGGVLSTRILPRWSVHLGSSYEAWTASGTPDLDDLPMVFDMAIPDASDWQRVLDYLGQDAGIEADLRNIDLQFATDVRLNRRDSIIIQAQANLWSEFQSSVSPDELPEDLDRIRPVVERIAQQGDAPIASSYVATASWQLDWRRASLRIGGGISSVPWAWALQSTELTWQFGGKSRISERRMMTHWRRNRDELAQESRAEKKDERSDEG